MEILTIINSIILTYLLLKGNKSYYTTFKGEKTFHKKTLLGYSFIIWKRTSAYGSSSVFNLFIPIRNRRKTELFEEVQWLIADATNRRYTLNAKFSWLKTWEQVREFERDYSIVDRKQVEELVREFKQNKQYEK